VFSKIMMYLFFQLVGTVSAKRVSSHGPQHFYSCSLRSVECIGRTEIAAINKLQRPELQSAKDVSITGFIMWKVLDRYGLSRLKFRPQVSTILGN
jgi:hypothetical protein